MDLKIAGRKAVVLAASQGLGKAIAQGLAQEGASVFLCARTEDTLKATAEELTSYSKASVHHKSCDLTDESSRQSLIDSIGKAFDTVDILVHNIGGPKPLTVEQASLEDWQHAFEQLFQPVIHLNKTFLPKMVQQKWGRIVLVTSLSVVEPIAGLSLSNAMRAAVTAMAKTLSDEVAQHNITVNCVAPGWIGTTRTEVLLEARTQKSGMSRTEYMNEHLKNIPAGRMGTPEEFANVVCFLASEPASYVTGSTICVDGGKRRSTY